ncbi:hypothetical protein D3C86_1420380 [compost metagenome]
MPCGRPCRNRALAYRQRIVGDHGLLGDIIDSPQTMAGGAGALHRIWRKILRIQHWLPGRIGAGARIEHAHKTPQRGDTPDGGTCIRRTALLLERNGRRQSFDGVHLRHADLIDQPSGIGGYRLEVAPLGFRIECAERQGRLP